VTAPPETIPGKAALLGIRYDASSSFQQGPAEAPTRIREALWSPAGNPWTEAGVDLGAGLLCDEGDLTPEPGDQGRREIEAAVDRILTAGRAPLVLGGDHSVTYPVVRAVRRHYPQLSVLHFDAHPDLYDSFEGDPFSHACPFARVMEEGLADRLVQVGVRTMNPHQREQAGRYRVEVLEMKDWRDDVRPSFDTPVYLSFDLDVLEPGLAPGVSHREPGGLTVRQALRVIQSFEGRLIGADLVEFNPLRDPSGLTASVAAKIVKELAARLLTEPSC